MAKPAAKSRHKAGPKKPARRAAPKKTRAPRSASRAKAVPKTEESKVFGVEVEPGSIEKTLQRVRGELTHWMNKGRYTKVRFKLRGKPILPDLPIGAVIAAEAVTFWWAGLLRALLVTVGAKAVLDVELVNDAEREVARGKDALLSGDLDGAVEAFLKALSMDRDLASAHLSLGIARKLQGNIVKARESLQKAEQLDSDGPIGEEARRLLDQFDNTAPKPAAPVPI